MLHFSMIMIVGQW